MVARGMIPKSKKTSTEAWLAGAGVERSPTTPAGGEDLREPPASSGNQNPLVISSCSCRCFVGRIIWMKYFA